MSRGAESAEFDPRRCEMPRLARHDPIASNPILIQTILLLSLPPRKSGLNCCNFFIGEVVKCFMGERAKLAAAAAAAVLLDDHELLKLPGTVRCFRELMEGIRRGMERYDYYTFSIPDIVVCQTSRHVLHTNFSSRRFLFFLHFSRIFSVRK